VDNLPVDLLDGLRAVDSVQLAIRRVVLQDGRHLAIEDFYPPFSHRGGVVTAVTAFASTNDARHQLLRRHV
jgi:hypothetical protein